MRVTTHQLGRRHRHIADRVHHIADQAATIVTRHMREPIPHTHIIVTQERHVAPLITAACQAVIQTDKLPPGRAPRVFAETTINESGVLVVINASCHDEDEVDTTVIHELAHAVQFGRTGVRDLITRSLRDLYGLEYLSRQELRLLTELDAKDEREAEALEYLAAQLRET